MRSNLAALLLSIVAVALSAYAVFHQGSRISALEHELAVTTPPVTAAAQTTHTDSFRASSGYVLKGAELDEAKQLTHDSDKLAAEVEYSWTHPASERR